MHTCTYSSSSWTALPSHNDYRVQSVTVLSESLETTNWTSTSRSARTIHRGRTVWKKQVRVASYVPSACAVAQDQEDMLKTVRQAQQLPQSTSSLPAACAATAKQKGYQSLCLLQKAQRQKHRAKHASGCAETVTAKIHGDHFNVTQDISSKR